MTKFGILVLAVTPAVSIAGDEVPADSNVVQLRTYATTALAELSPGFSDTQACKLSGGGWVAIDLATGKSLYSTMLAASMAKQKVGVELSGCSSDGLYPLVQRIDVIY